MRGRVAAWAQLLRVSALFTVPGDAVAGAVAAGRVPGRGTALAAGSSLCLYEAGMALNDWADRAEDAVERPERPLPSGRVRPAAALAAATGLTAAGLALAARAGRLPLATASALAATVWAYDLRLKHTPAGPAAMATARALDVLLGATTASPPRTGTATAPGNGNGNGPRNGPGNASPARALSTAAFMGAHTLAVTAVSRREAQGGAPAVPLAALGAVAAIAAGVSSQRRRSTPMTLAATAAYVGTAVRPLAHAALNPSPPLLQRAVGGGIRAMIPLQAALAARAATEPRTKAAPGGGTPGAAPSGHPPGDGGGTAYALALLALIPLARRLSRKVSPT
ncbi:MULTISPECIES: SCO3242 family prenyltransferase [unclassified Streptomyces]|uniref:SCO3242 family prenyltransferase n=1 Tax=unclassified Streptomyces TaxID=2593676 RepID=UPI002DD8F1F1|nr:MULTISPECIES: UbiA family prenyltransferase [unclassified Streptomyces]WSA91453.1 UbiA family prenyltransferase [Streptomyces sp. NBC_01795]WSB75825.1 UbiA family prenyltransferase [Streptomyces sp. NBC_01775]WSS15899.1 UbiA family prenyltransferase [Streptomyces sp. NBC_01186]WSS44739.1 UbiA family prenyltransferase [Streptomyces sp. NBC_01187]